MGAVARGLPAAVVLMLALVGCSEASPMPTVSGTSTPSPSATPTPSPEPDFTGDAADNQAFFDMVNRELIDSGVELGGAVFIDNLVANGYSREAMEVTSDTTAIGRDADNIVFSIRFDNTCLLGQWGNIGYTSLVTEVLSTGRCIVGTANPA